MTRSLPVLNVDDFESPVDYIRAFYQELGWDSETQELDPRKIKIHPEMWGDIVDQLREKWGLSAALGWMNIGPSADESNVHNLAKDEVFVGEGAIKDSVQEIG